MFGLNESQSIDDLSLCLNLNVCCCSTASSTAAHKKFIVLDKVIVRLTELW